MKAMKAKKLRTNMKTMKKKNTAAMNRVKQANAEYWDKIVKVPVDVNGSSIITVELTRREEQKGEHPRLFKDKGGVPHELVNLGGFITWMPGIPSSS